MASNAQQDSELRHSFGPLEVGFDYLPLELPAADEPPLPTGPRDRVPVLNIASTEPFQLREADKAPLAPPSTEKPNGRVLAKSSPSSQRGSGMIWLDGDVLMCACPDCRAPMSIRIWLMVADCWRCGASIELNEEQEREVQRLLDERERKRVAPSKPLPYMEKAPVVDPRPEPHPKIEPVPVLVVAPVVAPAPKQRFKPPPEVSAPSAAPQTTPISPTPVPASAVPPRPPAISAIPARRSTAGARRRAIRQESWLNRTLKDTPAWLISLLVHLVAITLTALFTIPIEEEEGPFITLSTMVARNVNEGGDVEQIEPDLLAKFDLPLPSPADLKDDSKREALLAANQDARDLRLDDDSAQQLPEVAEVKSRVGNAAGIGQALAARDPRLRVEMVTHEGGTTLTEAAVARGLRWLANHQNADGSWSLNGFRHAGNCNCGGDGAFRSKAPGTALAMLPFLGAGQTHLVGKYRGTVARGVRWMIENQKEDGDLRAGANDNSGMYTHGQAAIVLCEAFAMTGDEQLRLPAQKAIDFIVEAQYDDGGWRYRPSPKDQAGDTSVVGWQLMALQSARAANLTVPEQTLRMADQYLNSCSHRDGALYSYQARGGPTPVMTAEGLLCRMYLGWKKENPSLRGGVAFLAENHLPSYGNANIYYWYYATQTMHHYGGPEWDEWNLRMRDILVQSQETRGHAAGSWAPRGDHASAGGRIYMTALAICTLEVYYRHLPIFRQIELE